MINIKQEAEIIAHGIDKPFDFALERRLIATIIDGRARLIRNSIKSNRDIPSECIQTFGMEVEKVEAFSLYYKDDYKVSVKTKERVPTPIRLDNGIPFISVTSQDGSIVYSNGDFATLKFNSNAGRFVSNTGRYIYHAEHIACYHNEGTLLTSPIIVIRGIVENPLEVSDVLNHYVYSEDNFPMPMDMAYDIRQMIYTGDLRIVPANQTVTIDGK